MSAVNNFQILAHGPDFDADAYVATSPIAFDRLWRRGEGHYATTGIAKVLGDGVAIPLPDQQEIAIKYLAEHRDALKALRMYPGMETFILGLHFQIPIVEGLVGFAVGPSDELMARALDVGMSPMFYVVLDRPEGT